MTAHNFHIFPICKICYISKQIQMLNWIKSTKISILEKKTAKLLLNQWEVFPAQSRTFLKEKNKNFLNTSSHKSRPHKSNQWPNHPSLKIKNQFVCQESPTTSKNHKSFQNKLELLHRLCHLAHTTIDNNLHKTKH